MATSDRKDPYPAYNYVVEIDGVTVGGFSECTGLQTETPPIEYRNGDEDTIMRKLLGLRKNPPLVLKRGFTQSKELWEWRKKVINGKPQRCSGSITLLDEGRQKALEWKFREGWPSKWDGPALNAKNNEIAIETLEICHEGLELA